MYRVLIALYQVEDKLSVFAFHARVFDIVKMYLHVNDDVIYLRDRRLIFATGRHRQSVRATTK